MNISASILGSFMLFYIPLITILGFYLGNRKTKTPKVISLLAFLSAFIPPISIIFLIVLALKDDNFDPKSAA